MVHRFGSQKIYEMPIDCGSLGALNCDIHFVGDTITHIYIRINGSVMVDVLLTMPDKAVHNIKQACLSWERDSAETKSHI